MDLKSPAVNGLRNLRRLQLLGMKPLDADPCIYMVKKRGIIVLIAVYIDDIQIASNHDPTLQKLRNDLSYHFKLRDLGPLSYFLGLEFQQSKKEGETHITITQKKYTRDLLERYGMSNCKSIATPMDANAKLRKSDDPEEQTMSKILYKQ